MNVPNEGVAPQPPAPSQRTTAYYMGITIRNEVRYHTFVKNCSNRGSLGSGDQSPHGLDAEAVYYRSGSLKKGEDYLVQGSPYSFNASTVGFDLRNNAFEVVSVLKDITLFTGGEKNLPFLRGYITPYVKDPRFVLFNPTVDPDDTYTTSKSFKIYGDKTKSLENDEVITQMTTLKYPSGMLYPSILSASCPLSKSSLSDILPEEFVSSVCVWGKVTLLIGCDEHPLIPTITLSDILTGPKIDSITNTSSLSSYLTSILTSKYRNSPTTPENNDKRTRASLFKLTHSPTNSVLIWTGRMAGFGLPEAKRLGKVFAPLINTRIAIAANMVSNFSPSSSFLDLNTDIFATTETHHLDLIDGSVKVANYVGAPPILCNKGIGNVRTFVIATLRTTELKPHDCDNNIFPPLNIVTGIAGTTPHHGDDLDTSVNPNTVIVKVQTKKVEALRILLGATPAVKSFGALAQTRNAR